jgi:hypothetical protein
MPLAELPNLTLLQIGGYPLTTPDQLLVTDMVAKRCERLLVVGWLGLEGETNWYGIWRREFRCRPPSGQSADKGKGRQVIHEEDRDEWPWHVVVDEEGPVCEASKNGESEYDIRPLGDGDLFTLEEELAVRLEV